MTTHYHFRNLVFQGGGVRMLAYHGTIRALEETGILDNIERVAGTSAGALIATLLSFRLPADETIELFNNVDLSKVPTRKSISDIAWDPPQFLEYQVDRLVSNWDAMRRFLRRFGWHGHDHGYAWLHDVIATQCEGNGRATFAEFKERGFRELYVVATNISQQKMVVFNADDTPDVAVVDALIMSQSIPIFFEAIQFDGVMMGQGDYFADGGVLNNYPLQIFDYSRFLYNPKWFVNKANWETLGVRLFTSPDCPTYIRPVTGVVSYLANLLVTAQFAQDVAHANNRVDQCRTIEVDDCCVSVVDFNIKISEKDEVYKKLVASGYKAVYDFLDEYTPPTADQIAQLRHIFNRILRRV